MYDKKLKQLALKRRLQGKSYGEIIKELKIPKSTLATWLVGVELSESKMKGIIERGNKVAIGVMIKRNKKQTIEAAQRTRETRRMASQEIKSISKRDMFIIGCTLYWAEGYKRVKIRAGREVNAHAVALTNSDPELVVAFLKFLRNFCLISDDKITVNLRIFPGQDSDKAVEYWSKVTCLPKTNFRGPYITVSKSSKGKKAYNRLEHGVVQIRVGNTQLFHRIMGYIDEIKRKV